MLKPMPYAAASGACFAFDVLFGTVAGMMAQGDSGMYPLDGEVVYWSIFAIVTVTVAVTLVAGIRFAARSLKLGRTSGKCGSIRFTLWYVLEATLSIAVVLAASWCAYKLSEYGNSAVLSGVQSALVMLLLGALIAIAVASVLEAAISIGQARRSTRKGQLSPDRN